MEVVARGTRDSDAEGVRERQLMAIVSDLARDLHPQHTSPEIISSSSRLERDLGIDSLGRTELVLRVERAFSVRLSINLIAEATTVDDLRHALEEAGHSGATTAPISTAPRLGAVAAAS